MQAAPHRVYLLYCMCSASFLFFNSEAMLIAQRVQGFLELALQLFGSGFGIVNEFLSRQAHLGSRFRRTDNRRRITVVFVVVGFFLRFSSFNLWRRGVRRVLVCGFGGVLSTTLSRCSADNVRQSRLPSAPTIAQSKLRPIWRCRCLTNRYVSTGPSRSRSALVWTPISRNQPALTGPRFGNSSTVH